ncbi:hypothetical protein [Xanthomonas sp. NCPPB 2632]|uniref:hypothetical protein n=1 Tax=Xanthomonas sp. NCPPB 2632 TaxID=3240912 RepID=UPI003516117E
MDAVALPKLLGLMVPLLAALIKFFAERRASSSGGKVIAVSVKFHDFNQRGRFAKLLGRMIFWRPGKDEVQPCRQASVFIWNQGSETISEADLFEAKPLAVHVAGTEVRVMGVTCVSHGACGVRVARMASMAEWAVGTGHDVSSMASITFDVLTPRHGFIVDLAFMDAPKKNPKVQLIGPVLGLRRVEYKGVLSALPMASTDQMFKLAKYIDTIAAVFLALFVSGSAFALYGIVFEDHVWFYRIGLLVMLIGECAYLLANEARKQLKHAVPDSLAYWDKGRSEWSDRQRMNHRPHP